MVATLMQPIEVKWVCKIFLLHFISLSFCVHSIKISISLEMFSYISVSGRDCSWFLFKYFVVVGSMKRSAVSWERNCKIPIYRITLAYDLLRVSLLMLFHSLNMVCIPVKMISMEFHLVLFTVYWAELFCRTCWVVFFILSQNLRVHEPFRLYWEQETLCWNREEKKDDW